METARTYYNWHGLQGSLAAGKALYADDLEDKTLIERVKSKREITIDAVEHFYQSIIDHKPYSMAQIAADATFTSLLGRMAYQTKREVTWEELLRTA